MQTEAAPKVNTGPTIAVLGAGSIGRRHLANLRALGVCALLAYDPVPEMRARAALEGFKTCATLEAVWAKRPDVVLVCAPSNLHVELAREAICASANTLAGLFIEKPVSHTRVGLAELRGLLDARGIVNLVGCNMRFHPGPAQIKRWLETGRIGDVLSARLHTGSYLPRWRAGQNYHASYSASPEWGGAILDCIHEIDLALWLLGPGVLRHAIVQPARSLGLQTDGLAELLLAHKTGAVSSLHMNFVQRNYRRSIEVIGSEGTLHWDFQAQTALRYAGNGEVVERVSQPLDWTLNQMYMDEMQHFLACVARHEPSCNPVANAAATLEVALLAREDSYAAPCCRGVETPG